MSIRILARTRSRRADPWLTATEASWAIQMLSGPAGGGAVVGGVSPPADGKTALGEDVGVVLSGDGALDAVLGATLEAVTAGELPDDWAAAGEWLASAFRLNATATAATATAADATTSGQRLAARVMSPDS